MTDSDIEAFNRTLNKFLNHGMADGCCSSISPCSHQQRDPTTICESCQKAAEWAKKQRDAEESGVGWMGDISGIPYGPSDR